MTPTGPDPWVQLSTIELRVRLAEAEATIVAIGELSGRHIHLPEEDAGRAFLAGIADTVRHYRFGKRGRP